MPRDINGIYTLPAGNPVVPGTVISTNWANTTLTDIAAALSNNSPVFTGTPTAPTPPQFDNDASLATTEFVQRALGNYRSANPRTGNQVLEVSDAGSVIVAGSSASPLSYTTPPLSAFPIGASVAINNLSEQTVTLLQRAGSDRYISAADPSGTASHYVIKPGAMVTITKYGTNLWLVHGPGDLVNSPLFGSSLAANGYQKLPSGLIIQWGKTTYVNTVGGTITFPIAFPNACLSVICNVSEAEGNYAIGQVVDPNSSWFYSVVYTAPPGIAPSANTSITADFYWTAIGH